MLCTKHLSTLVVTGIVFLPCGLETHLCPRTVLLNRSLVIQPIDVRADGRQTCALVNGPFIKRSDRFNIPAA